ncbi:hypothetical protein [Saccharothrix sp. ST-888]|nr:hypothetical protein [Saccharothrix sp. ST-888]
MGDVKPAEGGSSAILVIDFLERDGRSEPSFSMAGRSHSVRVRPAEKAAA